MNSPLKKHWKVENIGIDLVPKVESTGKATDLFWIWSAANIGILGIVYGAIVVDFRLSFFQSILAVILGVTSFVLVAFTSFAGKLGRTSTLTLSRVIFGVKGNIAPTIFSWINLIGWDIINVVTGTLTLAALLQTLGMSDSLNTTALSLLCFSILTVSISMLGKTTLVLMQSSFSLIFGTMTLVIVVYIFLNADWYALMDLPNGSWLKGFLPAVSIIAAGTGISWAIAGADYSRYQSDNVSCGRIFAAVVGGAFLPLFLLIFTGILLSVQLPNLASSDNPIALIGSILPRWMAIPYLMTATAGISTIATLSMYSASLNLLTIGIKVKQVFAVSIDTIIVLVIAVYILFISQNFMGSFIAFLISCGVFLAAWEAIFILDYLILRRKYGYAPDELFGLNNKNCGVNTVPLLCWFTGATGGLLVTKTDFINGPLALGIFADSSLGLLMAFTISLITYGAYLLLQNRTA